VDGSDLEFPTTANITADDMFSQIYQKATDIDFEYAKTSKCLEL
jgi:hypothetical protein